MKLWTFLLLAVPLAASAETPRPEIAACVAGMMARQPPDVAAWIRRDEACMRWNGDESVSHAQAISARTPPEIRGLRCDQLYPDERRLRRRYASRPEVAWAIDRAKATIC